MFMFNHISPKGRKPVRLPTLHHHHPLQRGLRLFLSTFPHHQGEKTAACCSHEFNLVDKFMILISTLSRLLLQLLHEAGVSLRASFLFLSSCAAIHLFRTFFLLPRDSIPYPLPDHYTYGYASPKHQNTRTSTPRVCFRDTSSVNKANLFSAFKKKKRKENLIRPF